MKQAAIQVLDTTLRDGAQSVGVAFSVPERESIARALAELGVDIVEGGWPGSNPRDTAFFESMRVRPLPNGTALAAFGSTRRRHHRAENDPTLAALLQAETPVVVIFGKGSRFHAEKILGVSAQENLDMIFESVQHLAKQGRRVVFDSEHFFDAFAADSNYALDCLKAAHQGGAENLSLADTNGGALPAQISAALAQAKKALPDAKFGIHTHNDGGLATANTLAGVEAGATLVHGTINGIGERTGNADLCSVLPNLALKMGRQFRAAKHLSGLTALSRLVDELGNLRPDPRLPFVGRAAFAHKGGVHVSAMQKNPASYQHISPNLVGNAMHISVSELSGKSNIQATLQKLDLPTEGATQVLQQVKQAESTGISFEAAPESFELLARLAVGEVAPFALLDANVQSSGDADTQEVTAALSVEVSGKTSAGDGTGTGPVHAMDTALRAALLADFPVLNRLELVDFSVRVLHASAGTSAGIRVLAEHLLAGKGGRGHQVIRTCGVSQNIIVASLHALVEAFLLAAMRE